MGELPGENDKNGLPDQAGAPLAPDAADAKAKTEIVKKKKAQRRLGMAIGLGIVAVFAAGLVAIIAIKPESKVVQSVSPDAAQGPLKIYAKGTLAKLITHKAPKALADIEFYDADKKPLHLSDYRGQVLVLNVWATWCGPCRVEMPTLALLQTHYDAAKVMVLPLSVDTEDKLADVKSFMGVHEPLEVYVDPHFAAPSKFTVNAMPTTLIIDKQGREVARLEGEAKWDQPEVKALLDHLQAQ